MITHTGKFHQLLFPSIVWRMNSEKIFLTFDDGPHPSITPQILELLAKHSVNATFFLSGKNISGNEQLVEQMNSEGHSIGIHAYFHSRKIGFSQSATIQEIRQTEAAIHSIVPAVPKIFRPPFGFFTWKTIAAAKKIHYKIIMWSCLTGDFRPWRNEKIIKTSLHSLQAGSILVFHDNRKTEHKILPILNEVIPAIKDLGFSFGVINE